MLICFLVNNSDQLLNNEHVFKPLGSTDGDQDHHEVHDFSLPSGNLT